jgi:polysaccharide biosynthesis protein PslJ
MSTVAAPHVFRPTTRTLPAAAPLYLLLLSFPIWWVLGAGYFIWPLLTLPLALALLLRRRVVFPPHFGVWLLFLACMLLSRYELQGSAGSNAFLWRASVYVSATVLFLYVYNAPRRDVSDRALVGLLVLFWIEVVAAGFVGLAFPHVTFHTPLESLVPASFASDETVQQTLHPGFSEVQNILGYPVGRPRVLFPYANHWGACVGVLTPFALLAVTRMRRGLGRRALIGAIVLSVVPLVFSLDRGVWLALCVGLLYLCVRFVRPSNARAVGAGAVVLIGIAVLVAVTPLGTLTQDRVSKESNSNNTRLNVYATTTEQVKASPLLGYGSPTAPSVGVSAPPAGTQSQIGLVTFSHGLPALALFIGWFMLSAVRTARRGSTVATFAHLAILIGLVEMAFYSFLPTTLHVIMIAAAVAWRDVVPPWPETT